MRIIECEQQSPEWFAVRLGVPTASEFGNIITAKRGDYAAAADTYINALIDETFRPGAAQSFTGNRHTRNGNAREPDARGLYSFLNDLVPRQVGFILNDEGTLGCSPDSLIDPDGGLEIKAPDGATHVKWLRAGELPDEHKAQVHGCMIVTGRPWWDFMSYCPPYPPLDIRCHADGYTDKLRGHLARFLSEYHAARELFSARAAA